MSRKSSDSESRILRPQSPAEIQWRNAIRFFFEYLPLAALIMLVAVVIRAAYHQPATSQFSSEEASKLKRLAEQPPQPSLSHAEQLRAEEAAKLQSQTPHATIPADQFTPADVQALKGIAANSKQLDRLADNSNDLLSKKFDAEEMAKLKDDVQRYLEWVIAIAGIFSIAQTIAAAYASQSFARQAERDVNELNEFKKSYEVVARAGQAQQRAFDVLEEYFGKDGWVDWRRDLYGKMLLVDRQLILSADRYLGYDLLLFQGREPDPASGALQLESGKLRGLANFYTSKYDHEQKLRSGQWQDLERANHLLQSWLYSHSSDFKLHNDLGVVLIKCADHCRDIEKRDLEADFRLKARTEFKTSAELHRRQQRAYFNIARIDFDTTKPLDWPNGPATEEFKTGLRNAEKSVRIALEFTHWETKPDPMMRAEIVYNLACFLALLSFCHVKHLPATDPNAQIPASEADVVLKTLEEVAGEKRGTILKRYVDNDFDKPTGDLFGFRSRLSKPDLDRLDGLRRNLSRHAAQDE